VKSSLQLQLAFHHHQPVGNLPEVLEDCYQKAYRPLMECLVASKRLKVHLSFSGPLLRFLEREHPEYLEWVRTLVEEDRVEFLATGFYEPVLVDIAKEDRIGQLEMNCRWIEERFGLRPRGAWLAEGVWKNFLAHSFNQVGLKFTLIRSDRFLQAGIPLSQVHGHYFTEYLGETLALFPVDRQLTDLVPFSEASEWVPFLRRQANRKQVAMTYADVAERWGIWPGTHEQVQASGAAQRFFEELDSLEWVQTSFFSEALERGASRGRCYLPEGAGIELGAWSLPDQARKRFHEARDQLAMRHDREWFLPYFRAGSWEGFRARYGEAHLMAKKGQWLRQKMLLQDYPDPVFIDALWQSQCNTAYWHGISGGIYLPHLREAIWECLLMAHRRLVEDMDSITMEEVDFDGDGIEEILVYGPGTSAVVSPAQGGAVVEFSLLAPLLNLSNTLTRRSEGSKDENRYDAGPPSDQYERHWFHDRFLPLGVTPNDLDTNRKPDLGNFTGHPYRVVSHLGASKRCECTLEREGRVESGGVSSRVRVRKTYLWTNLGRTCRVDYQITNEDGLRLSGVFATEWNLILSASGRGDRAMTGSGAAFLLAATHYEERVEGMTLWTEESGLRVQFEFADPACLWAYPLFTAEGGAVGFAEESLYQGTCLLAGWTYEIEPGGSVEFALSMEIGSMKEKKGVEGE